MSCTGCSKPVKRGQTWLKCSNCDSSRCKDCSKGLKVFICGNCDASEQDIHNFVKQEIQQIKESFTFQLNDIKKELQALKPLAEVSGTGGESNLSNAVHAEVDKTEMAKCLVLSGLEEIDDNTGEQMTFGALQDAVVQSLTVCDPSFNPAHLDTCLRMGNYIPQRKRLVKIILRSVHVQRQIVSGSKKLYEERNLRIRPSKPLEERKKDSALIKKMFDFNNNPANKKNPVKIDWKERKLIKVTDPNWKWDVKIFKDPFLKKSTDPRPDHNDSHLSTNSDG